jgi:multidrug efflux pump subunit AcrA (membrane-fusion protein)
LPGNVQAFQSSSVYARTDGYLARWLVDIGDHVEKVQMLAEIEPSKDFEGRVVRTAGALDPASRTLLTELEIPNHDGALFAGMYARKLSSPCRKQTRRSSFLRAPLSSGQKALKLR